MMIRLLVFLIIVSVSSCGDTAKNNTNNKKTIDSITNIDHAREIILSKSEKLSCIGDFNGDGVMDTIRQGLFSGILKMEIDSAPNGFNNAWDKVVKWFYNQEVDVYLVFNGNTDDTLHLGPGLGLYCLINIGDNNKDGKEEIAFVKGYADYSRLNTCLIYSICHNGWQLMDDFEINESAFDVVAQGEKKVLSTTEISGFLERKNKTWYYMDYKKYMEASDSNDSKMEKLKIGKCNSKG